MNSLLLRSQEVREKFSRPNRIERNRKFSYKGRTFVAEEMWIYRITDTVESYTNYNIAFAFEGERVTGIITY
jgi:hypothetical protein